MKIKNKSLIQEKLYFQLVSVKNVENFIKNIPSNKVSGGDIPVKILKQSEFIYQILKGCINKDAIYKGVFPDSLKIGNITPAHKIASRLIKKTTDQSVYFTYYQKPLKYYFMINSVNT